MSKLDLETVVKLRVQALHNEDEPSWYYWFGYSCVLEGELLPHPEKLLPRERIPYLMGVADAQGALGVYPG